jgi:hypothetical protein
VLPGLLEVETDDVGFFGKFVSTDIARQLSGCVYDSILTTAPLVGYP